MVAEIAEDDKRCISGSKPEDIRAEKNKICISIGAHRLTAKVGEDLVNLHRFGIETFGLERGQ